MLNSGEELYTELRDKNFSAIGGILRAKTSEIQDIMKQKEKGNMSVGEMKRLVQNLPAIQALKQSLSTRKLLLFNILILKPILSILCIRNVIYNFLFAYRYVHSRTYQSKNGNG